MIFELCCFFCFRVVCGWAMAVSGQVFVGSHFVLKLSGSAIWNLCWFISIITNSQSKILFLKSQIQLQMEFWAYLACIRNHQTNFLINCISNIWRIDENICLNRCYSDFGFVPISPRTEVKSYCHTSRCFISELERER